MTSRNGRSEADDPAITRIREIRARMWKQGGGTAQGYLKLMRELAESREQSAAPTPSRTRKRSARPTRAPRRKKA